MATIILGNGHLGRAIAAAIEDRGEGSPTILGRPANGRHRPAGLAGADLVFDASRPEAVVPNLAAALAAGCRRMVIATTGWNDAHDAVDDALRSHGAAAVAAPNFSLGVAGFLRLVELSGTLFAGLPAFDPYVVEWHRRGKLDRPSGTAREIGRRLMAADPRKHRLAGPSSDPPAPDELELVSIRAGSSPGMHLVGFDAPGETLEIRHTARDRSAFAAGALAAGDWLGSAPRPAGLHTFDEVLDDVFATGVRPASGPRKRRAVAGPPGRPPRRTDAIAHLA